MAAKIVKISMTFADRRGKGDLQYELTDLTNEGLDKFELPFDPFEYTPENFHMEIFDDQNHKESVDWNFLDFLRQGNENDDMPHVREYKQKKANSPILRDLEKSFWQKNKYAGRKFPLLEYSDITERDMFGSDEISEEELLSHNCGVWSACGLRKLKMEINNMLLDRSAPDFEQKGILYWNKIDSKPIVILEDPHVIYHGSSRDTDKDGEKIKDTYYVYCDTDQMADAISADCESAEPQFSGRFELHFKDRNHKESWAFPVRLCVLDSRRKRLLVEDDFVSLDFGTSSTCAAYQKEGLIQLLRLSGTNKTQEDREDLKPTNEYENPTNLMIYNWNELWRQWNAENPGMPLLQTKFEEMPDSVADYDSGHTVEKVYHSTDDEGSARKMGAIISELKTVPYVLSKKREIKFTPINDYDLPVVHVIDSDREDRSHFNPIKLYGYIISRVINQPRENRYYTKFKVTYPVKFQPEIKEKIRASLAEGIMRALPRPIREEMDPDECVIMEYQESVACIGACIPEQLSIDPDAEDYKPAVFSVFDLGGGTWDTSYGVLRVPLTEEEEENSEGAVVQILHTGGDEKMGAERLLHRLAFQIYKMNQEQMVANQIPFILPEGESLPAGINQKYLPENGGLIPEANVHAMIEQIARPFFQAIEPSLDRVFGASDNYINDVEKLKIILKNKEGDNVELTLSLEDLEEFLKDELIGDLVKRYYNEMIEAFENNDKTLQELGLSDVDRPFDMSNVQIFLGGNASRQRSLEAKMKELFAGNVIKRIGEKAPGEEERNLNQRITAKTAVAIGQLKFMLNNIMVVPPKEYETIMQYNVGFVQSLTGKFKSVLNKSSKSREWVKANLLLPGDFTALYFTSSSADNVKKEELHYLKSKIEVEDPGKRTLYLRVYPLENNAIEYRLGSARGEQFSPDEEYDESRVLRLEEKLK